MLSISAGIASSVNATVGPAQVHVTDKPGVAPKAKESFFSGTKPYDTAITTLQVVQKVSSYNAILSPVGVTCGAIITVLEVLRVCSVLRLSEGVLN